MPENGGSEGQKRTKMLFLCSRRRGLAVGREEISIGKRKSDLPANHRARQCAPEVPRTGIRVRDELLELHPRPGGSLIWRRYGGGVGNRCRWVERFAMSEQQSYVGAMGMGAYM